MDSTAISQSIREAQQKVYQAMGGLQYVLEQAQTALDENGVNNALDEVIQDDIATITYKIERF